MSCQVTDVVATADGWLAVGREDPICNLNCALEPVRLVGLDVRRRARLDRRREAAIAGRRGHERGGRSLGPGSSRPSGTRSRRPSGHRRTGSTWVPQTPSDASRSTLKSSENGSDWHPGTTLPPDSYVVGVAPPTAPGRPWLVAIEREDPEEARILASRDLVSWTRVTFDKPGIRGLTATTDGWVAVGFYPSRDTGCYEIVPAGAAVALYVP